MEQTIIKLSKDKWNWMREKQLDNLNDLFHENAVFVRIGVTMTKSEELNVIKNGDIFYEHAEIEKNICLVH